LVSPPFIDIPLIFFTDENKVTNVNELFRDSIYINLNTLCNEEIYINENENSNTLKFYVKKYEILNMPPILSINLNINNYELLKEKNKRINELFTNEISLYNSTYEIIGFVTQPYYDHFIAYFKCLDVSYKLSYNEWFKLDDL
jgi:hypothetical protein